MMQTLTQNILAKQLLLRFLRGQVTNSSKAGQPERSDTAEI